MNSQDTNPQQLAEEQQIVRNIAGLPKETEIIFIDTGWDSRVYSFSQNGEWYFVKFPRSEKIQGRYAQEIAALDVARDAHASIVVPEILWRGENNAYFGYKGVPGTSLRAQLEQLSDAEKRAIGATLGEFLRAFHAQYIVGARDISIEKEIAQFQEWYEPAKPIIKERFTDTERRNLETLVYTTWPEQMLALGRTTALCHGDVHLQNIMYADGTVGIIDFGDVAMYDCSKDLIDLEEPAISEAVMSAYGDTPVLRQKIAVRSAAIQIISLTYHIKKQHTDDVDRHLEIIRQLVV